MIAVSSELAWGLVTCLCCAIAYQLGKESEREDRKIRRDREAQKADAIDKPPSP